MPGPKKRVYGLSEWVLKPGCPCMEMDREKLMLNLLNPPPPMPRDPVLIKISLTFLSLLLVCV